MNKTPTPHDHFFYQVMSQKNKAMAFFARYLPDKVLSKINLEDISLAESKHLSNQRGALYNDVLYKCKFDNKYSGYLFAICEHQSTPNNQMPLRLLEYNAATIKQHLKQEGKDSQKFPVIVNIVLYHGSKPWNYSTAFVDYYENPSLGKEFLDMAPFTLVNIPILPTRELTQDKELGFCFMAFRCTSYPDPYEAFERFAKEDVFRDYLHTLPEETRSLMAAYLGLCTKGDERKMEDWAKLVSRNPQEEEIIMNNTVQFIRQQSIQEGMQQGMQLGRQEGMQEGMQGKAWEIAKNLLYDLHLDMSAVSKATGLSQSEIIKLQQETQN